MSINKVIASGNLTRDPELRSTAGGMSVLSIGLAVNERVKGPDGEWSDRPNFIDCSVFGKRAESLSQFLSKGSKVCIEGKLRYSQWEKDGQKRSKLEVIVEELEFMSGSNASHAPSQQPQQPSAQQLQPTAIPMQPSVVPQMVNTVPQQQVVVPQQVGIPIQQQPMQQAQNYGLYDENIPF